jgi:hypothetical protein
MPTRSAFALLFMFLFGNSVRGEILPTFPLRELTVWAQVVVLVEPIDVARPGRFRVAEALKGQAPRIGGEIEVAGLDAYFVPKEQPDWRRIDGALLFLRTTTEGRYELIESGVRLHTREGTIWWPVQPHNPGGYRMVPENGISWEALLLRARSDAAEANRVRMATEQAEVTRRDSILLEWVERHRTDFTDGRDRIWSRLTPTIRNLGSESAEVTDLDANGWGELQLVPFNRVLQGRVPGDCWRAVNLYADMNQGELPPGATAAFASRSGRQQLLAVARDGRQLDGRRARALRILAEPAIIAAEPPDVSERTGLLDGLLPLLNDRDATRRGWAARAVLRGAVDDSAATDRAISSLRQAYRSEQPGPTRNALAEAFYELAGPQRWSRLTGRPDTSLALIRDLEVREDKLLFWLTLRTQPLAVVKESPTLIVEQILAGGEAGKVRKIPLALPASARDEGWRGKPLLMELNHADLMPGTWRLRVIGVAGTDRQPWESEPRTLRVVVSDPARARQRPDGSLLGNLLRSVTRAAPAPAPVVMSEDRTKRTIVLDGEAF